MAFKTIQCLLKASEQTLQHLWTLMSEKNTPLINQTLETIRISPELNTWISQGYIPNETIEKIINGFKQQPEYKGTPHIFYLSAEMLVKEIYQSWFAVQLKKRLSLKGKRRWLTMLRSEEELLHETSLSLPELRIEAEKILAKENKKLTKLLDGSCKEKLSEEKLFKKIFFHLIAVYKKTEKDYEKEKKLHLKEKKRLKCYAIVYLLKNKCRVSNQPEDPEVYEQYRKRKEVQIERLEHQLKSRLPKGRENNSQRWIKALESAQKIITTNNEIESVQAHLLSGDKPIPFPISYYETTTVQWYQNEQGRISVKFGGLIKQGHVFEVFCGRRQLHWFKRFVDDYQLFRTCEPKIPAGLITLRSVCLLWQKNKQDSDKPWLNHSLYLYCSVNTELWTREGTEKIREIKISETESKNKKSSTKGSITSLNLLKSFDKFSSRPRKYSRKRDSSILLGISIGLKHPATVTVVDVLTKEIKATYDTKQLLSKPISQKAKKGKKAKKQTQYEFLLRHRQKQQENKDSRRQAQIKEGDYSFGESNLGQYVDRLIAKAIIEIALRFRVSSIVLPDLTNIREITESEVQAKARIKNPGCKKAQKIYSKKYRKNLHEWSYKRLSQAIESQAVKKGIDIEYTLQKYTETPDIQAKNMVLNAYEQRKQLVK